MVPMVSSVVRNEGDPHVERDLEMRNGRSLGFGFFIGIEKLNRAGATVALFSVVPVDAGGRKEGGAKRTGE